MTPFQAAAMFAAIAAKAHRAAEHALERAAKVVEAEAKREIGTYQGADGPFPPWPELADSTKQNRVAEGFPENDPLLRTGEMRDSIEHHVRMTGFVRGEAHIGSDNEKAVWQELGTVQIPPRSFLGRAAFRKGPEVKHIVGNTVVGTIAGRRVI